MLTDLPARLEYACGHHALVTIQTVRGESPRQRRERVEKEKAAALERRCDFCGPVVVAEPEPPAELVVVAEPVSVNGDGELSAEVEDALEAAIEAEVEELVATVIAAAPSPPVTERRARRRRATAVVPRTRYRVSFVGERDFAADSISEAVRQAEALGLREIVSVVRVERG